MEQHFVNPNALKSAARRTSTAVTKSARRGLSAGGVFEGGMTLLFMGPMVAGGVGWGVKKLGGLFGSEKMISSGEKLSGLNGSFHEKSIGQLSEGSETAKKVGGMFDRVFGFLGDKLQNIDKSGKLHQRMVNNHASSIQSSKDSAIKLLEEAQKQMAAPKRGWFSKEGKALSAGAQSNLNEMINKLKTDVGAVSNQQQLEALTTQFTDIGKHISGINENGAALKGVLAPLEKAGTRVTLLGQKLQKNLGGNLAENIKNIPKNLSNKSINDLTIGAATIGYSIKEGYEGVHRTGQAKNIMGNMYRDMTGKQAGARTLMFGDVPLPLKILRKEYGRRNLMADIFKVAGGIGNQVAFAKTHNSGMGFGKQIALTMLPSMVGGLLGNVLFKPSNSLEMYDQIADAKAKGMQVPMEAYADLFRSFTKQSQKTGKIGASKVEDIAAICAAQQIELGDAMWMVDAAMKGKDFAAEVPQQHGAGPQVMDNSHQPQQVLGQHTQNYLNSRAPQTQQGFRRA